MNRFFSILIMILFLFVTPCFADDVIEFSADKMNGVTAENADYTKLSGNAKIKTSDMEISADTIELSGKDFRYIKASGKVSGKNSKEQLDFTCGQLNYDRIEKIAVFTGDVNLIDGQNDVVADAQRIEYREKTGIALMQIEVKIVQKDNVCSCAFATYRKNQKMLEMTGNPQVVRGKDTFRAQEITFNLDTEEITLDGRVRGNVTETSESKDNPKTSEPVEVTEPAETVGTTESAEEPEITEPGNPPENEESSETTKKTSKKGRLLKNGKNQVQEE